MKFPILIHLLNNPAKHIVMSFDELPVGSYFKVVRTGINPVDLGDDLEVDYRLKEEPVKEETKVDEPPQENNEPSGADSSDDGASVSSEDSGGTSL